MTSCPSPVRLDDIHPWPLPRPAGRLRRCMSLATDWALMAAAGLCLALVEGAVLVKLHEPRDVLDLLMGHPKSLLGGLILWHVVMGLTAWGYFVAVRAACGRTCGEAIWGVWLVREDGQAPVFADCTYRGVGALISLLPFGLGYWWSLVDGQRQSWHDRLSRTRLSEVSPPGFSP